jgi:hypothetical protein
MLTRGDIVSYFYPWSRQARDGEESGRKARPACVVVQDETSARLFLFPITSQPPSASAHGLVITEMECRRCGLNFPSWIICDEYNVVQKASLHDFESLEPIGRFSSNFFDLFKAEVKNAAILRRLKAVSRS